MAPMTRKTHRRVTARPRHPGEHRLARVRWYFNGVPVARGNLSPSGITSIMHYDLPEAFDVDDAGRLIKYGWA